ncbi:hypothetical protein D3Z36_01165 [Lachnospiraceae bacterium]|nr:hypothetical protein [Lachnospiraceae bacterium]
MIFGRINFRAGKVCKAAVQPCSGISDIRFIHQISMQKPLFALLFAGINFKFNFCFILKTTFGQFALH